MNFTKFCGKSWQVTLNPELRSKLRPHFAPMFVLPATNLVQTLAELWHTFAQTSFELWVEVRTSPFWPRLARTLAELWAKLRRWVAKRIIILSYPTRTLAELCPKVWVATPIPQSLGRSLGRSLGQSSHSAILPEV